MACLIEFDEVIGRDSHARCRICTAKYAGPHIIARKGLSQHIGTLKHQSAIKEVEDDHRPLFPNSATIVTAAQLRSPPFHAPPGTTQTTSDNENRARYHDYHKDEAGQLLDENWDPITFSAGIDLMQNDFPIDYLAHLHDQLRSIPLAGNDFERREDDASIPAIFRGMDNDPDSDSDSDSDSEYLSNNDQAQWKPYKSKTVWKGIRNMVMITYRKRVCRCSCLTF